MAKNIDKWEIFLPLFGFSRVFGGSAAMIGSAATTPGLAVGDAFHHLL